LDRRQSPAACQIPRHPRRQGRPRRDARGVADYTARSAVRSRTSLSSSMRSTVSTTA
jgi:hypothetical protein